MEQKRTVFITGVTGLVGSYLAKVFLENGHKVFALARAKDNKSAASRVFEVLNFWDENVLKNNSKNLIVVEGDITQENLGLNEGVKNLLRNEVEEIFHCAAVTKLNSSLEELKMVNIDGTRNVLDLGYDFYKNGKLKKINHFSTAYVCGDYNGAFDEAKLDVRQKFNTYYEQTKFEGEKIVEEFRKLGFAVNIFRPAAVVGESTNGKTFQFKNIYELFKLWSHDLLDFFPNENYFALHLSCVDHIANATVILSGLAFANRNYHLFGLRPFFTKKIFSIASECIGFRKNKLISFKEFGKKIISPAERRIIEKVNLFNSASKVSLHSAYTKHLLKDNNFDFPEFDADCLRNILNYTLKSGYIKILSVKAV